MKNLWDNLEEYIVIPLLLFAVVLIFVQVIMRYIFRNSLYWSEELARYIFLWTVWIGASYATKKVKHLRIKSFTRMFPKQLQKYNEKFVLIIWLGFSIFLLYYGYNLTNMKDSVSRDVRSNRVFCIDCVYYKSLKCPGWEACPFRIEALKSIQEELQRRGNNEQS